MEPPLEKRSFKQRRQDRKDFREWRQELRESDNETDESGYVEYKAPSALWRFGRGIITVFNYFDGMDKPEDKIKFTAIKSVPPAPRSEPSSDTQPIDIIELPQEPHRGRDDDEGLTPA